MFSRVVRTLTYQTAAGSVARKIIVTVLALTIGLLLTASVAFLGVGYVVYRDVIVPRDMDLIRDLLADSATAEIMLSEPARAQAMLDRVDGHLPGVVYIAILGSDHQVIAEAPADTHDRPGHRRANNANPGQRMIREAILVNGEPAGEFILRVRPELPAVYVRGALWASGGVFLVCMVLVGFFLRRLNTFLIDPINELIATARTISSEKDYSVRVISNTEGELGTLSDAFNTMIRRIEAREKMLTSSREKSEKSMEEAQFLTEETRRANAKLEMEIHDKAQVERQLTDFKNYLVNIINSMPSALITVDGNFMVTQWNREATRVSGTSTGDAMYSRINQAYPFLSNYLDYISRALVERETHKIEKVPRTIGDEKRYYDIVIYPLSDTGYPGAAIRMDDVTDRIQLEGMMVQTEKMMSVGGLAAGMAHEINNPLGAVVQSTQIIKRRISPTLPKNAEIAYKVGTNLNIIRDYLEQQDILRFLDNIQNAGERAAKIVSNMLQFSRRSDKTLTPVNLAELLNRSIEIARSDYSLRTGLTLDDIELITEFDPGITVPCMPGELEQVMLNLIKNSMQAIDALEEAESKGCITILARQTETHAVISVQDNGTGMDEETRKRIFEPFFTTKEVGRGTGLGLSVSYFIICTNHRGSMEAESQPGQGTKFIIRLPLTPDPNLSA